MTAIVGILCKDGVVLGTDSSATFTVGQRPTIEQPTEKLQLVGGSVIIAGTGQVGLGQRFEAIVSQAWNQGEFKRSPLEIAKHLARVTIDDFVSTKAVREQYAALVAFPTPGHFHLCEFALADFQPELKTEKMWYVSLGVTQPLTDSFLALMRELFWQSGPPNLSEGIFAATWVLDHAVAVNAGGVNGPIRIAALAGTNGKFRAAILTEDELGEHRQNIDGAKGALREYCRSHHKPGAVPGIPRA